MGGWRPQTLPDAEVRRIVGDGYESDMPGFGDRLSDDEIRAVLDYIKSTWPEREADHQRTVSRG